MNQFLNKSLESLGVLRIMGCAEMDSCKIPLTTDRNATFAKNSDFSKAAVNMLA